MTPTRMVTMNPMAEVQAYEILYRKKYSGASVIVINGIFEPVTSPEQLAKLTGRAGAGGLGPPNPIQATMESPVRKPATAPVCLTRLNMMPRVNSPSRGPP